MLSGVISIFFKCDDSEPSFGETLLVSCLQAHRGPKYRIIKLLDLAKSGGTTDVAAYAVS